MEELIVRSGSRTSAHVLNISIRESTTAPFNMLRVPSPLMTLTPRARSLMERRRVRQC